MSSSASTSTSSSSTTQLVQDILQQFYSNRRLLLHTPLYQSSTAAAAATPPASGNASEAYGAAAAGGDNTFDANVVMVLSVLLCALICSLGLNSIIRCALKCSSIVVASSSESGGGVNPSSACRLANTGIKKKALKTFPTLNYSAELKNKQVPGGLVLDTECVICLSEFTSGEQVRVLPKCHHGFHVHCIDKWLNSHSSCPTCRHCLIDTCQSIVCCTQPPLPSTPMPTSSSAAPPPPPPPPQETIINIAPLEPEGLICNFRGIS
ncbi:hypothetical protein ACSBR2_008783 [Camellia fascicularis]